jgi:ppGpp synthetase/RelA/SpoT-type nucleotidyltranferase
MYQTRELDRISKKLVDEIEDELARVGLFFRIFYRVKNTDSIENKVIRKGENYYDGKDKFIRDIIGIRIVLYFSDDIDIIYSFLKSYFNLIEETVDKYENTKFAPTRVNLIFRLPDKDTIKEFSDIVGSKIVDSTFEVQLRTILSEGWHEIDHDLRYKSLNDWENSNDLERNFNGILATLETSDYSTLRLFDQLSYRHYKSRSLTAMLKTKFRLKFIAKEISSNLNEHLTENFIKEIYKLERIEVLQFLLKNKFFAPLSFEYFIYLLNLKFIGNTEILGITPKEIVNDLKE